MEQEILKSVPDDERAATMRFWKLAFSAGLIALGGLFLVLPLLVPRASEISGACALFAGFVAMTGVQLLFDPAAPDKKQP